MYISDKHTIDSSLNLSCALITLFCFRTNELSVVSEYQYDDGPDDGLDVFSREPYGLLLQTASNNAGTDLLAQKRA